ncbi:MAG: ABC transporter permease DevC [Xenococcus sp. (in: cyanobacteria)]
MKISLAWLQISHQKTRLLVSLAGIAFADVLMLMQLGFQDALYNSATLVQQKLNADLVLISPESLALHLMQSFSHRSLYQTLALKEVESVAPIYLAQGYWKNPETRRNRMLMVFGFNPEQTIIDFSHFEQNIDKLKLPDVVFFDSLSRPEFGPIQQEFAQNKTIKTEINQRQVKVVGLFSLGASFAADGNLMVSDTNFLRIFTERRPGEIDIGLITLKPGSNPETVRSHLQAKLGKQVKVLTHKDFIEFEKNYWATSSAIGFIFAIGTLMGFMVGTLIVYQILYSDVSDHLAEYATLKAMGYTDLYLLIVVFQEALILALLGYLPGLSVSLGLYTLTKIATKLPIAMTVTRAITVLILTILMCFMSGAIAVRRLGDADPADIF